MSFGDSAGGEECWSSGDGTKEGKYTCDYVYLVFDLWGPFIWRSYPVGPEP